MDFFRQIINGLEVRIEALERNRSLKKLTIPTDGYFVIKILTVDPTTPVNGEMWINSTSGTFKVQVNSVTKTVTLT